MEGLSTTVTKTQEVNAMENIASTSHQNYKAPWIGNLSTQTQARSMMEIKRNTRPFRLQVHSVQLLYHMQKIMNEKHVSG